MNKEKMIKFLWISMWATLLAKLTDEQKAIATNKGWALA